MTMMLAPSKAVLAAEQDKRPTTADRQRRARPTARRGRQRGSRRAPPAVATERRGGHAGRAAAAEGPAPVCFTDRPPMPKMKTHSGAKKRFRLTATGKVEARRAFSTHILEKKSPKRKRRQARPVIISDADEGRVKTLLGAKHRRGR